MSENEFHRIDDNLFELHEASYASTNALNESSSRILKAEDFTWNCNVPKNLTDIVLRHIADNFEDFIENYSFDKIPLKCQHQLFQLLSTNLPLNLTANILPDGIYWKRLCHNSWTPGSFLMQYEDSWKRIYMEKYLQNLIETNSYNTTEMKEILQIIKNYILSLNIEQLLTFNVHVLDDSGSELTHIDLNPILASLPYLKNFSITCGVKNCGMEFAKNIFQLTLTDCINIANGLKNATNLQTIKIHRCALEKNKLQSLSDALKLLPMLQEVNFTSCSITGESLSIIIQSLTSVSTLRALTLMNNKIGPQDATELALTLDKFTGLRCLNLRLNFIFDVGGNKLIRAATRHNSLTELILAGCELSVKSVQNLCNLILTNKHISKIDLHCNCFGKDGGKLIAESLSSNNTLQVLDLRMNNISSEDLIAVSQILVRNRNIKNKEYLNTFMPE